MRLRSGWPALLAFMLLMGACSSSASGGDAETSGSDGSTDAASGDDSSDAAAPAGDPIVVGLAVTQSGPLGVADHQDWINGVTMAVEELNAAGGVLDRPLEIELSDVDILSPEGTTAGFQALADAEVDAILSPFALIPQPAMDAAAAYGAPYLHGNTAQANIDLFDSNPEVYANQFQMDVAEKVYGEGIMPFFDAEIAAGNFTPKNNRVHIVQAEIAYTQLISAALQESIAGSGGTWEVGGITDIQSPVQDWTPIVQELKDSDAGVIVIDHWVAAELAAFAQAYAADPVEDAVVYLQYGPSQPEFLDLAGDAAEGFVWGSVWGTLADEKGQAFRDAYMAKFPGTMGLTYTGGGYDTMYILAAAWEAAGTTDFEPAIAAIRDTQYRGVSGFYSFDESQSGKSYPTDVSDPEAGLPHLFFQVQDGQHTIIAPDPFTQAELRPAPWMN